MVAQRRSAKIILMVLLVALPTAVIAGPGSAANVGAIACQAMEVKASARFAIRLVVFHYRDQADRNRLGQLLRKYDGGNVQFETRGGPWRPATVLRLKTCFGRGLLVFSASGPKLARGDEFLIEFPSRSAK